MHAPGISLLPRNNDKKEFLKHSTVLTDLARSYWAMYPGALINVASGSGQPSNAISPITA